MTTAVQAPVDPIGLFESWYAEAVASGVRRPDAMTLATADENGMPSARVVLFKGLSGGAFTFFTNYGSRKGRELAVRPFAALVFHWEGLHRQVRVEGRVLQTTTSESDEYWASRPRGSQLSAVASQQSHPIQGREQLESAFAALSREFEGRDVPRPEYWGGYHVVPDRIEFWQGAQDRLHHRALYTLADQTWAQAVLAP